MGENEKAGKIMPAFSIRKVLKIHTFDEKTPFSPKSPFSPCVKKGGECFMILCVKC